MKNPEKEQKRTTEPTAIDYLNTEWAQESIASKIKIAKLMEENDKLREVIDKQNKVIESYKDSTSAN